MAINSPIKNPVDNVFEQLANISKAHGYDILSEQVGELKKENAKLRKALSELLASYKLYVKNADESEFVINAVEAMKPTKYS